MLESIINFEKINTGLILVLALVGISLFLYGVTLMSDGLKKIAGQKMKDLISSSTNTTLKGIVTGTIITALVQSSTGVSVLVVGLVGAGLMTLRQSVGVIMGANIGTTLTSIIIGLPVSKYGLLITGIGLIVVSIIKNVKINNLAQTVAGLGMIFLGLEIVGIGMINLAENPFVGKLFTFFSDTSNPLFWFFGLLFGILFTAIVQSSSLSIALLQKAYTLNVGGISLVGALPILLGFGIGTTFTSVFASIGQNNDSKRVSMIYILFNLIGSLTFIILLKPYTWFIQTIHELYFPSNKMIVLGVAYALQNIITTFVLYFFVNHLIKLSKKIIKDKKIKEVLVNESFHGESIEITLSYVKNRIELMGEEVNKLISLTKKYIIKEDKSLYTKSIKSENIINEYNEKIYNYLLKNVNDFQMSEKESKKMSKYLDVIRNYEKIGDNLVYVLGNFKIRYEEDKKLTSQGQEDLMKFIDSIEKMAEKTLISFKEEDIEKAKEIRTFNLKLKEAEKKFRYHYLERLKKGEIELKSTSTFASLLTSIKGMGSYLDNIADTIVNPYEVSE